MQDEAQSTEHNSAKLFAPEYVNYQMVWRGQTLTLRWSAQWFGDITAHLVIETQDRKPHPISETGYRSHFAHRKVIEDAGGPVAFVRAWLEREDDGNSVQLSLF